MKHIISIELFGMKNWRWEFWLHKGNAGEEEFETQRLFRKRNVLIRSSNQRNLFKTTVSSGSLTNQNNFHFGANHKFFLNFST